jgi:transposase
MGRVAVGVDVAKEFHWAQAIDTATEEVLVNRRVENDPASVAELIGELEGLEAAHGQLRVGIDVLGGIAALLSAMLLEAGIELVHVSGLAVNRARQGTAGGENKSDPRDARAIAELVARRHDLRQVESEGELDAEIRLLVSRRRELVVDQTRRVNRVRDLLASIHPGLEAVVDPTQKGSQRLLMRYVTPAEIRAAGLSRLVAHVAKAGRLPRSHVEQLADRALAAARAQTVALPAEAVAAGLVRELAAEAWAARERIAALDTEIEAALARHPDAALIRSLPGRGATLTAEFIAEAGGIERFPTADRLAAAAGLAPVLKQSGKVRYLHRPSGGNKALKRVFFQSAFCSLGHPASRAFYSRKRSEGKRHHQAVIALARRRVDVLHAMLRNRTPYEVRTAKVA